MKSHPKPKARITIMVHKTKAYKRMNEYEDKKNSSIVIKVTYGKGQWICLYGFYRQWKIPGKGNALNKIVLTDK